MLRAVFMTGLIAGAVFAAQTASAQDNVSHVSVTFETRDMREPGRAEAIYARIERAAKTACWIDGEGPAFRLADDRACQKQAVDEAVADLHSDEINRLHAAHTGSTSPQMAMAERKAR
jgi:UrcA family protein